MDMDFLMDLVNAKINDDARRTGVMTLGRLREALAVVPPATPVVIEGGGAPGKVDSYRGYYERLAFEPIDHATAAQVLETLNAADGQTFYGYKGGEYEMDEHTFLHVAPYGCCGPYVSGLRVEGEAVVLETTQEEW